MGRRIVARLTGARTAHRGSILALHVALVMLLGGTASWMATPMISSSWRGSMPKITERLSSSGSTINYMDCDHVRFAGAAPLFQGSPGYRAGLDADLDGIACEPLGTGRSAMTTPGRMRRNRGAD